MNSILIFISYFQAAAEIAQFAEYQGILDRYQVLLRDHEQCVRTIGDDRAAIRGYEELITRGLHLQLNELKNKHEVLEATVAKSDEIGIDLSAEIKAVVAQQNQIRKAITDINSQLAKVEETIKNTESMTTINRKFEEMQKEINALKNSEGNKPPEKISSYFSATSHSHYSTSGKPMPLNIILTEENSGYDGSTGVMTVIYPGTYFWGCRFETHTVPTTLSLKHNDGSTTKQIQQAYDGGTGTYRSLSMMATLKLDKGDKVWVQLENGKLYGDHRQKSACNAFKID